MAATQHHETVKLMPGLSDRFQKRQDFRRSHALRLRGAAREVMMMHGSLHGETDGQRGCHTAGRGAAANLLEKRSSTNSHGWTGSTVSVIPGSKRCFGRPVTSLFRFARGQSNPTRTRQWARLHPSWPYQLVNAGESSLSNDTQELEERRRLFCLWIDFPKRKSVILLVL